MTNPDSYWIWSDETKQGPFTKVELYQHVLNHKFQAQDLVIRPNYPPCTLEEWLQKYSLQTPFASTPPTNSFFSENSAFERATFSPKTKPSQHSNSSSTTLNTLPKSPEFLLWEGTPSIRKHSLSFLLCILGTLPFFFFLFGGIPLSPLWWLIPLSCSALLTLLLFFRSRSPRYLLSNHRLIIKTGNFLTSTTELRLSSLRSISCHRSGFSALLNVGSLELHALGHDSPIHLKHIASPKKIEKMIRKTIR